MGEAPTTTTFNALASNPDQLSKPFRLLDLPPEIWSTICRQLVESPTPLVTGRDLGIPRRAFLQPPITRVCRTLRAECLPHFYASNLFLGLSAEDLRDWISSMTPESRRDLKRVYRRLYSVKGEVCYGDGVWEDREGETEKGRLDEGDVKVLVRNGWISGRGEVGEQCCRVVFD